jgi:hypothetical protein
MLTIEQDFTRSLLKAAKQLGWRTAHFKAAMLGSGRWATPVQGDGKGWPDLVLVRGKRLLFVELKSLTGEMSDEQVDWMYALWQTGAECYLWTPNSNWMEVLN